MRTNKNPVEFFIAMKKKPAQQALYDNVKNLSYEEIEKCGQPLWIRNALKKLKDGYMNADQIADLMEVEIEEIEYPVFRYKGPNHDLKLKNGTVEISTNDLILVLEKSTIIANMAYEIIDLESLLKKSDFVNRMLKSDFFAMYQKELEAKI